MVVGKGVEGVRVKVELEVVVRCKGGMLGSMRSVLVGSPTVKWLRWLRGLRRSWIRVCSGMSLLSKRAVWSQSVGQKNSRSIFCRRFASCENGA